MITETSAGGVLYKKSGSSLHWLLVKHSGYHKWGFPKGHLEAGETPEQAALREVKEESGVVGNIVASIGTPEHYIYTFNGERRSKNVYYFLMEYVSGEITDHDFESEDVRWATAEEVEQLLGFEGAKKTFQAALSLLKN